MADPNQAPPLCLLDGAALFLDFDGTLVELADVPDAIEVPGDLIQLLGRLGDRLQGRIAIVSGRSLEDLESHVRHGGIAMSGSHGLELRFVGGPPILLAAPSGLRRAREEIADFARGSALLVEEKPASIALHYRQAPARAAEVEAFMAGLATRTGLSLLAGKMVTELRPAGADKGDAVRALMAEPTFANARPVFVGDDRTDEDAFAAAAELGGAGILVGPPRPSAALYRLADVAAVRQWLGVAAGGKA